MMRGAADVHGSRWADKGVSRSLRLALVVLSVMSGPVNAQSGPAKTQSSPAGSGLTLNDAVARTLELDAQIAQAKWALEESHGALMTAQGAFDLTLATSAVREDAGGTSGSSTASETVTQYDVGFSQRLRAGIIATPQLSLQRSQLPSVEPSSAFNVADMGLVLTVPMLRGRGGGLVTASEKSARWAREASASALEHQRAVSVLLVAQAYWSYAAAIQRIAVLRASEERARKLLEQTRTLIAADEQPAADEIRVRANYASKRASRLAAEGALIEARGTLAETMGVSQEILSTLPEPVTPLPDLSPDMELPTSSTASELALAHRRDLVAAQNQSAAAAAVLSGAQSESRPRFDLSLGLGYGGAATGSPLDAFSAAQGVRTSVGFSFGLPFQNRDAAGLALQDQARRRQAEIERTELARQISLDAATAADRLHAVAAQLSRAREATELSEQDVQNEEVRFRLGVSTLIDLLFSQDALTSAALGELDAQLSYATSLAQLRFETGTLFQGTGETAPVDINGLAAWSAPSPTGGGGAPPRE